MAQSGSPSEDAKEQTKKVARKASPWIDRLARMGYVAKGVVYVVIGFLALREALGIGGETTGPSSAFRSIGSQPFGGIMVALLSACLACFALWRWSACGGRLRHPPARRLSRERRYSRLPRLYRGAVYPGC